MTGVPGVFLSHAGEDNDRFAREFAKRLQEAGCHVWFDEWEILPGDSLVDKVFEEGLKDADAMVVVLSENSVDKPWVREELNAGFIKRIEGNCKLIPVVIDDVEVPGALRSTVWQRIAGLDNYEQETRPHHPRYLRRPEPASSPGITGLRTDDGGSRSVLHGHAGPAARWRLHLGDRLPPRPFPRTAAAPPGGRGDGAGLPRLAPSLGRERLRGRPPHDGVRGRGGELLQRDDHGLDLYAHSYIDGYDAMLTKVAVELVNGELRTDRQIAAETGVPRVLVEHVFDVLESQGLLRVSKMTGPNSHVHSISPRLGRMLQDES